MPDRPDRRAHALLKIKAELGYRTELFAANSHEQRAVEFLHKLQPERAEGAQEAFRAAVMSRA